MNARYVSLLLCSGCANKPTDIVFLLDSSASEGRTNFQKQLIFVRDFLYQFQIGPDAVQVLAEFRYFRIFKFVSVCSFVGMYFYFLKCQGQ